MSAALSTVDEATTLADLRDTLRRALIVGDEWTVDRLIGQACRVSWPTMLGEARAFVRECARLLEMAGPLDGYSAGDRVQLDGVTGTVAGVLVGSRGISVWWDGGKHGWYKPGQLAGVSGPSGVSTGTPSRSSRRSFS